MGRWHAERWQQLPVDITGFYDPASPDEVAARFGAKVFKRLSALVEAVDIVDVCTPTPAHREGVLAAAAGGKAAVCEKPIARRLSDAREMISACEEAGVPLFIAQVVRFFPQYERAKAALERGDLGEPGVIRLLRSGSAPRPQPDSWYYDAERSGGVMMDLSIHDLDFARWCFGEVERVFARGSSRGGVCEHALITLGFENGALGHIEGSWASPPGPFRTALEIAGTGGVLEWDSGDPTPFQASLRPADEAAARVPQSADSPLAPEDDPYFLELEHFLAHLERGTELRVTPQDALAALELSLAAIASLETGQPVTLAPFRQGTL